MSIENVKLMFAKIQKDATLQKNFEEAIKKYGSQNEETLAQKLIEFGGNSGFAFSKDDLMAARAEFIDKTNENAELHDKDLANVAGGGQIKTDSVVMSILTAGIGCAVMSIFGAHLTTGCAHALTTDGKCHEN